MSLAPVSIMFTTIFVSAMKPIGSYQWIKDTGACGDIDSSRLVAISED